MPNTSKLYLHFEGLPEFTQIVRKQPDETRTVGDLCVTFAEAYTCKHTTDKLEASRVYCVTKKAKVLAPSESVTGLFGQGDIFVKQAPTVPAAVSAKPAQTAPLSSKATAPRPVEDAASSCDPPAACLSTKDEEDIRRALPHPGRTCQLSLDAEQLAKLPSCHNATLPEQALAQLVSPYLLRAEDAEQQKLYKIAATIYEQVPTQAVSCW